MELIYTDKSGNQIKYTAEMITNAIDERNKLETTVQELQDIVQRRWTEFHKSLGKVYDLFKEYHEPGTDDITLPLDEVNNLLSDIGLEKLKTLYTVTGRIEFSITDVEASSEDEAREIAENELTLEFSGEGSLDSWDVDIRDASEQ